MKKYGFYLHAYGKDCFMESDAKRRTNALALEFLNKIQNKRNGFTNIDPATVEYVKSAMRPATLEIKTVQAGKFAGLKWADIYGDGFSFGCDACNDPFEKIIVV